MKPRRHNRLNKFVGIFLWLRLLRAHHYAPLNFTSFTLKKKKKKSYTWIQNFYSPRSCTAICHLLFRDNFRNTVRFRCPAILWQQFRSESREIITHSVFPVLEVQCTQYLWCHIVANSGLLWFWGSSKAGDACRCFNRALCYLCNFWSLF